MHSETAHGRRSDTKNTKITTITKTQKVFVLFVAVVFFVSAFAAEPLRRDLAVARGEFGAGGGGTERQPWAAQAPHAASPTQAQQRPLFRGGTHFVRVDAYPIDNGRIVEGLQPDDFEIREDGAPQAIESFDYVSFETFTPEAERREPHTQQEGFDMAADPRNRVFVIVVDLPRTFPNPAGTTASARGINTDIHFIQQPLIGFLDRVIGPRDLFGFLTTRNTAHDLVLMRKTGAVEDQIRDLFRAANIDRDEADDLDACANGAPALKPRFRDDQTYTTLETLVAQLGAIREERKSVIFVANSIARAPASLKLLDLNGGRMPNSGNVNGRIGIGDHNGPTGANDAYCTSEVQRLAAIDFDDRYRRLLDDARHQNVSFYVVTPEGLATHRPDDNLISLANETGGIPIVNTNDLASGMKKIADDLQAYYVLGYYTTNTKFDGGLRKISVKVKGKTIRARREYRAPTEAEIAALARSATAPSRQTAAQASSVSPREAALIALERADRPFVTYVAVAGTQLTVVAELSAASIQAGRWKDGADVAVEAVGGGGEPLASAHGRIDAGSYSVAIPMTIAGAWPARVTVALNGPGERPADDWIKVEAPSASALVGEAMAYRSSSRTAARPVAAFEFARNEKIRIEWPILSALDRREVRLLDRSGKPLPVDIPLSEDAGRKVLVVEMSLSGLPRADYLFDLTAGSGASVEHRLLAIRMKP
jgi:VWFA-related protein